MEKRSPFFAQEHEAYFKDLNLITYFKFIRVKKVESVIKQWEEE